MATFPFIPATMPTVAKESISPFLFAFLLRPISFRRKIIANRRKTENRRNKEKQIYIGKKSKKGKIKSYISIPELLSAPCNPRRYWQGPRIACYCSIRTSARVSINHIKVKSYMERSCYALRGRRAVAVGSTRRIPS